MKCYKQWLQNYAAKTSTQIGNTKEYVEHKEGDVTLWAKKTL